MEKESHQALGCEPCLTHAPPRRPEWVHFEVHLPGECALEHSNCGLGTCLGFPLISEDGRVIPSQIWEWGLLWDWQIINNEGFFFLSWIPPALLSAVLSNNLALVFLSEGFKWNDLNSRFVCTLSFKELLKTKTNSRLTVVPFIKLISSWNMLKGNKTKKKKKKRVEWGLRQKPLSVSLK